MTYRLHLVEISSWLCSLLPAIGIAVHWRLFSSASDQNDEKQTHEWPAIKNQSYNMKEEENIKQHPDFFEDFFTQ